MKIRPTLLLFLSLLLKNVVSAQLTITAGAQLTVSGNTQLTLSNTDLINNGNLDAGNGLVIFSGNASSAIRGSQPTSFFELEVNKSNGSSVLLQRNIEVSQRILFNSGFLNLNNFNTDLGTTAHLDGEKESSRVTGSNGGQLLFRTVLNAPAASNPANLGAIISSGKNLGPVIIKRGHQSQTNVAGIGTTLFRYYDIEPANNTDLDATLRFNYFDAELNGLAENSLLFYNSIDAVNWFVQGFTARNPVGNFVEKTGINSFARWTLSSPNNPLPVHFVLFNARCDANSVLLIWKTAQEQNSGHFEIEKSTDGIIWSVIGSLIAAGNSNTERTYSFTDNNPSQNNYYRIAQFNLDGSVQYSSILRSSCEAKDQFNIWPNPVHDVLNINIVTGRASDASVRIFDSKGALVKIRAVPLLQGSNQFTINMSSLPNAVYHLSVSWNNGEIIKTAQVVKQ